MKKRGNREHINSPSLNFRDGGRYMSKGEASRGGGGRLERGGEESV